MGRLVGRVRLRDLAEGSVGAGREFDAERRPEAEWVTKPMEIRATYKRRALRAIVTKDGEVRLRGRVFDTPSAAAEFVVRRPCNGWSFWRYEAEPGTWVRLAGLRGK